MSQAIQPFTPPPAYQGNLQQQQISAALASSSSGMGGDSIAPVVVGVASSLLTVGTILAVAHFATSAEKPKPAQGTSSTSKPVKKAHTPELEVVPASSEPPPLSPSAQQRQPTRREIHYYPQIHSSHGKYAPEVPFLQRSILDDLSSRKIEDVFSEALIEINHGESQEFYKKSAESAFKEYEPGQNLTEPQKVALGLDGAAAIYPYMPTTTWPVTIHPTESASLYEERKAADKKYFDGMDRRIDGLKDGTNSGPSEQDIHRLKSEYEEVVYDAREDFFANALRDFFKNNPTKKRAAAIMGSAHENLPDLIEKKIPGAKVIKHDFQCLSV